MYRHFSDEYHRCTDLTSANMLMFSPIGSEDPGLLILIGEMHPKRSSKPMGTRVEPEKLGLGTRQARARTFLPGKELAGASIPSNLLLQYEYMYPTSKYRRVKRLIFSDALKCFADESDI